MLRVNKNRDAQHYTGYLLKKTTNVQYQNRAIYELATNPTNADLYDLYELNPINNQYMRTQDTAVATNKNYYIQTWEVIPGNEAVLAEDKVVNKGNERHQFKFGYLNNSNEMHKEMDVINTFEENMTFIIYTDDDIPVATTDSIEIDDTVYGVIGVYREGHDDTNRPLKKPTFTLFITLKT